MAMGWYRSLMVAPVVGLLLFSAWTDLATRTIPDAVAIAVALLGAVSRLLAGPSFLAWSVGASLALFLLLAVLHARGLMGGGDVKLAAAICLGLSLPAVYLFIVVTTLAGGVLAVLHLIFRRVVRGMRPQPPPRGASPLRRVFQAEQWRIARRGSLPYAAAIACGGIWAVLTGGGG